jgi:predicted AAA+ superfamily ATPase
MIGSKKIVVFDEAQTIQDIGVILKAFIDTYPDVQIIATGSSSFDLANKINEPLTGRSFEFILYPLSIAEIKTAFPNIDRKDLDEYMRLGTYPAVVAEKNTEAKESILKNIATNYLYKDVYIFESIKKPRIFEDLVRVLALQIGSLVSVNEISQTLGISRATVDKYVRLLEQSYVIKVVRSFSRNPRTEIKKAFKIYFIDIGVRNAIIDNIGAIETRNDKGAIFENLFVIERLKNGMSETFPPNIMFWKNRGVSPHVLIG